MFLKTKENRVKKPKSHILEIIPKQFNINRNANNINRVKMLSASVLFNGIGWHVTLKQLDFIKTCYTVLFVSNSIILFNRCNPELGILWKKPAYRGVQTKVAYFILLKSTYRITYWTTHRHFSGRM